MMSIIAASRPVFASGTVINGPDVVFKQASSIVTINDIILLYQSDGRFISATEDGYTGNGASVGTYDVTIVASDGITEITKNIQVKVLLDIGNVTLVANNGDIYLRQDQVLNFTDIRNILRNIGRVAIPVGTGYQILVDDYTGNETEVGVYDYSFRLISSSGFIQNVSIKIYVSDDFTQFNTGDIIPGDPNPFDDFFSNAWNFIVELFWIIVMCVAAYFVLKFIFRKKKVVKP